MKIVLIVFTIWVGIVVLLLLNLLQLAVRKWVRDKAR